jgi:hypothetical protein
VSRVSSTVRPVQTYALDHNRGLSGCCETRDRYLGWLSNKMHRARILVEGYVLTEVQIA